MHVHVFQAENSAGGKVLGKQKTRKGPALWGGGTLACEMHAPYLLGELQEELQEGLQEGREAAGGLWSVSLVGALGTPWVAGR